MADDTQGWTVVPEQAAAQNNAPSAGVWEDRGMAGKVWHPADRRNSSDVGRADNSVGGLPPEMAALSALAITRAAAVPAANMLGRAKAAMTAAGAQATPVIKYEITKSTLQAMGVPAPLAMGAAVLVSGYRAGGGSAKPSAPSAPNPALPLAEDIGVVHGAEQFRTPYGVQMPAEFQPVTATTAAPTGPAQISPMQSPTRDAELLQKFGGRQPYTIPPPTAPTATPMRMADGSWGYRSIETGEPLAEGTTAHVVTRSGKTFTTTVPAPIDTAADVRQVKVLVQSGLSLSQAAMKASEGNAARFGKIMSAFMSGGGK